MSTRRPEDYVHGGSVIVPARVAGLLGRVIGDQLRLAQRLNDPEFYQVLVALRLAGLARGADIGTSVASAPEPDRRLVLDVSAVAKRIGIGSRAVRKAITEQRLEAEMVGGRWIVTAAAAENFQNRRARK